MGPLSLTQVATAAAQFLGVLDSGGALSAQQLTDALNAANNLIDNWSSDRLMAVAAAVVTQATSLGTASYSLGTRYSAIEAASILSPAPQLPLKVLNAVEWAAILDKGVAGSMIRLLNEVAPERPDLMAMLEGQTIPTGPALAALLHVLMDKANDRADLIATIATSTFTNAQTIAGMLKLPGTPQGPVKPPDMATVVAAIAGQPRYLFYDRGNPTATIYLAGPPQSGSIQLVTWTAMALFADTTTPLAMQPGYARMLELALAVELAPQYDMAPNPALMANLADARAGIRRLNASILGPEPPAGESGAAAAPEAEPGGLGA